MLYAYKSILGPHKAEEEVNKIMEEVDKNGSGSIDYTGIWFNSLARVCGCFNQQRIGAFSIEIGDGI